MKLRQTSQKKQDEETASGSMASCLSQEHLSVIFQMATSSPDKLCLLSGVCRDWCALIQGKTVETTRLWKAMEHTWWRPLLESDLKGQYRQMSVYGALGLGIDLNRFGCSQVSCKELCYRQRMYFLLLELKQNGVTGKRSIETAEHLMGSGDYVQHGRASKSAMRLGIRKGLIAKILVSEVSPCPCYWNGPCGGECSGFGGYDDCYSDPDCSETDEDADEAAIQAQRARHEEVREEALERAREVGIENYKETLNDTWNDSW